MSNTFTKTHDFSTRGKRGNWYVPSWSDITNMTVQCHNTTCVCFFSSIHSVSAWIWTCVRGMALRKLRQQPLLLQNNEQGARKLRNTEKYTYPPPPCVLKSITVARKRNKRGFSMQPLRLILENLTAHIFTDNYTTAEQSSASTAECHQERHKTNQKGTKQTKIDTKQTKTKTKNGNKTNTNHIQREAVWNLFMFLFQSLCFAAISEGSGYFTCLPCLQIAFPTTCWKAWIQNLKPWVTIHCRSDADEHSMWVTFLCHHVRVCWWRV